jgi:hypothetical protein
LTADHRAFVEPKIVETWNAVFSETGGPSAEVQDFTAKIAYDKEGDNSFEVNVKENNVSGAFTEHKSGKGTRTGQSFGSDMNATVYSYGVNGTFTEDKTRYTYVSGKYGAVALGTEDLAAGTVFAAGDTLIIEMGSEVYTARLGNSSSDFSCASAQEVVDRLNIVFKDFTSDSTDSDSDISSKLEAFLMEPKPDGKIYVGLRSVVSGGFELQMSSGSAILGITAAKKFVDGDSIFGTFHTEVGGSVYNGSVLLEKVGSSESGVESFEDAIDVLLTAPSSGNWQLADIVSQINGVLAAGHDGDINNPARAIAELDAVSQKVTIKTLSSSTDGYKSIVRIDSNTSPSFIELMDGKDMPVDGEQEKPVGESVITLKAAEKGSYGNKLVLRTETKQVQTGQNSVEDIYNIYVLYDGKEVSVYQRVSWKDAASAKFVPSLLANDKYLNMEVDDEDENLDFGILPDGDWWLGNDQLPEGVSSLNANVIDFTVGSNGWTEDAEGAIVDMDSDLIKALEKIYNPEVYDFNLVAAPGSASQPVQKAIQDICESRKDCFGVIDAAPFGIGLGVKENLNHVSEVNTAVDHLNSSYVGVYWPWLQDYDADNKQYVWLPPSAYALTQLVYTDNVADPWFAPAGLSRGKISALDVEYSPTRAERDILYGDTNIVNPIVKFVGEGIAIWGQKTAQRTKSALDRINVRRLMIYAEKLIARMARGFLFEQHDAANWAAFARQANAILEPIRQRRGLYQYQVICDSTTNTSDLINQNIMAGKIFISPTKTVEFIEVEFTINAAGEVEFTE